MPRLLYVVNIPRFFYTHRLPLALAAAQAGYEVHITTSDQDAEYVQKIKATGLPYHPLPLNQHGTNPMAEWRTFGALLNLYRHLKPDLVHQVSIKPVIYGGLAARLARVPAVVSAMSGLGYVFIGTGAKPRLLRLLATPAFRLALNYPPTRLIFQNPDDQALFMEQGLIRAEKTALIRGSGVDIEAFSPQPPPEGVPMVLFAGRLMWKKGLGDFVAAARSMRGEARFVVAGFAETTSPDHVPLEQLEAWSREGVIEWWGKRDDMPQVFAQSRVVCLPSSYGEGVPKVLIEAAACGRAIITTDTAGCREIVRHEVNGLLIAPQDVAGLVMGLRRLIAAPELCHQMGIHGREIAVREFSLEGVIRQTFALYRALLDGVQERG